MHLLAVLFYSRTANDVNLGASWIILPSSGSVILHNPLNVNGSLNEAFADSSCPKVTGLLEDFLESVVISDSHI